MKTKDEETTQTKKTPIFKINITNLQTSSYPDTLVETDLSGTKVGDYFMKGKSLYRVTELSREEFDESVYRKISENCKKYSSNNKYIKGLELCEKYKKSAYYGSCVIHLQCVLRDTEPPKRIKKIKVNEMWNEFGRTYYQEYYPTDLKLLVSCIQNTVNWTKKNLIILESKIITQEKRKIALEKLLPDTEKQPENEITSPIEAHNEVQIDIKEAT